MFARAAWVLLIAPAAVLAQPGSGPVSRADIESPVVPVHEEPHHRQVFQYGTTRILDLQVPPGDISWFHSHEWPVLYMTLGTSRVRTQNFGADWSGGGGGGARAANAQAGGAPPPRPAAAQAPPARRTPRATSTTSYVERPVTHRIENVGDGLFSAMVVVNETAGDETSSVADAGFDSEPELTNPWFRSYRVTLGAGETTDVHEHTTPVVIFQAIAGKAGLLESKMARELITCATYAEDLSNFQEQGLARQLAEIVAEVQEKVPTS